MGILLYFTSYNIFARREERRGGGLDRRCQILYIPTLWKAVLKTRGIVLTGREVLGKFLAVVYSLGLFCPRDWLEIAREQELTHRVNTYRYCTYSYNRQFDRRSKLVIRVRRGNWWTPRIPATPVPISNRNLIHQLIARSSSRCSSMQRSGEGASGLFFARPRRRKEDHIYFIFHRRWSFRGLKKCEGSCNVPN